MKTANNIETYELARDRVKNLKYFYQHFLVFVILSVILLINGHPILTVLKHKGATDQEFLNWVAWNILLLPVIWGMVVLVHGLVVFRNKAKYRTHMLTPGFVKRWEERQLEKYLRQ